MNRTLRCSLPLAFVASALVSCAPRPFVVEVRDDATKAAVAGAEVTVVFVYNFRLGQPPERISGRTDVLGTCTLQLVMHEPNFDIEIVPPGGGTYWSPFGPGAPPRDAEGWLLPWFRPPGPSAPQVQIRAWFADTDKREPP